MEEISVLTDPEEIKNTLAKPNITDIGAFLKDAALRNPDLVPDPQAFAENWDRDRGKSIIHDFKERAPDAIGTKRAELMEVLKEHEIGLEEAFADLTDKQKSYGKITAKLSFASGIDEIEKIFNWAEIEFGPLSMREKCLSIFQGAELIGTAPAQYRGIRKMFLEMVKGNNVEVKEEYLEGKSKQDKIQKSVCAKLLQAITTKDVEDIFDWAEVALDRQIVTLDRYVVFFQVLEMVPLTEETYKVIRKILIKMAKD
jgi:hypothetical protein